MVVAHFEKFTTGHCSQHLPGLQRKGNQWLFPTGPGHDLQV
jgi:hypothetical protein